MGHGVVPDTTTAQTVIPLCFSYNEHSLISVRIIIHVDKSVIRALVHLEKVHHFSELLE